MDLFISVWDNLKDIIRSGRLKAPSEVYNEITVGDDDVKEFVEENPQLFIDQSNYQIQQVIKILKKYPSLVNVSAKFSADPWIIALALEIKIQPRLVKAEVYVVTEEKIRGTRLRIPFVCNEYDLNCTDVFGMFRLEGWQF